MKELIALGTLAVLYCKFGIKKAYAWTGGTHEDITKKALALLEKENKPKLVQFYKNYHKEILTGCKQPDNKDDIDCGAGSHYYSCVNPKGKKLSCDNGYYLNRFGKPMKSARTMFEENYTCAVNLYISGKISQAMLYIGRAAHFIEDMSCTVHTANMRYLPSQNNIHYAYEKHTSAICSKIKAEKYDKRLNKYYEKDDLTEALNKLVETSGRYTDLLTDLAPGKMEDAAKKNLPFAQQNVMALFLKFYRDCTEKTEGFIVNDKEYTFTNAGCKLNMSASKKGIVLLKPDKTPEQKLKVSVADDGTIGLKTSNGGYVNGKFKGYDYLKIGTNPARFRTAAVSTRLFRISSEQCGFEKVLTAGRGGSLTFEKFRPGNPYQLWIIK